MAERYVPAAGRPAFTRLYDTVVALTMREATFRGRLRAQALDGLAPGAAVVDRTTFGCPAAGPGRWPSRWRRTAPR